jgi:hypothetical protein
MDADARGDPPHGRSRLDALIDESSSMLEPDWKRRRRRAARGGDLTQTYRGDAAVALDLHDGTGRLAWSRPGGALDPGAREAEPHRYALSIRTDDRRRAFDDGRRRRDPRGAARRLDEQKVSHPPRYYSLPLHSVRCVAYRRYARATLVNVLQDRSATAPRHSAPNLGE